MRSRTVFIAKDGKEFDSHEECLDYERNELPRSERDKLYDKYMDVLSQIQHMKRLSIYNDDSLPCAQNMVIRYKKRFLDARKYGGGTKSERFNELAALQYQYASSKMTLAGRIAEYRKLKAKLRELGKRLGFKNAKEVRDGE